MHIHIFIHAYTSPSWLSLHAATGSHNSCATCSYLLPHTLQSRHTHTHLFCHFPNLCTSPTPQQSMHNTSHTIPRHVCSKTVASPTGKQQCNLAANRRAVAAPTYNFHIGNRIQKHTHLCHHYISTCSSRARPGGMRGSD